MDPHFCKKKKIDCREELKNRIRHGLYWWPEDKFVDPLAKNVVEGLLRVIPAARYGVTNIPFGGPDGPQTKITIDTVYGPKFVENWKNVQLRSHPFMYEFPWKSMENRMLLVSLTCPLTLYPIEVVVVSFTECSIPHNCRHRGYLNMPVGPTVLGLSTRFPTKPSFLACLSDAPCLISSSRAPSTTPLSPPK